MAFSHKYYIILIGIRNNVHIKNSNFHFLHTYNSVARILHYGLQRTIVNSMVIVSLKFTSKFVKFVSTYVELD
jgi:hypothetical protein